MIKGFECARTQFFVNLHGAWRTQENVCAHKICSGAHRRAQKVVAAPEISGRSAILSRVGSKCSHFFIVFLAKVGNFEG